MENPVTRKLLLSTLGEEIEQAAHWLNSSQRVEPAEIRLRVQALREAAMAIGAFSLEKQLLELERELLAGKQGAEQTGRILHQLARIIGALENQQAGLIRGWLEPFERALGRQQEARVALDRHLENLQGLAGCLRAADGATIFARLLREAQSAGSAVREAQEALQQTQDGLCRLLAESTRASPAPLFASLREDTGRMFLEQGRPGVLLIESTGLRLPVELYPPLENVLRALLARLVEKVPRPPGVKGRSAVFTISLRQFCAAGLPVFELWGEDLPQPDLAAAVEKLRPELTLLRARLSERDDGQRRLRLSVAAWPGLDHVLGVDSPVGRCWLRAAALQALIEAGRKSERQAMVGPPSGLFGQLALFVWDEREYCLPVTLLESPRWASIRPPPDEAPWWQIGETHFGQPVIHPWPWLPMGENESCIFP